MQEQLKERLTGAAILVVIVVLAVPEMFHGRPAARGADPAAGTAAIPLRTYTIDLSATPAARSAPAGRQPEADAALPGDGAPLVPPPAAAGPAGVASGVIQRPVAQPAPAAEAPRPAMESPKPAVEAPKPAVEAPKAAAAAPQAAPPVVKAMPRPVPKAAPRPAPGPQAGAASGWAVQVGSFSRKDLAERMTRQVRAKGFPVQMVGPDARGLYRVRSALLADRAAAAALREKMVEKGFKPIINASP